MPNLMNYMETVVRQYVDQWLPKSEICHCEKCRLDIMALMLNKLPPSYVVTRKGELHAQLSSLNPQLRPDLTRFFYDAIRIVSQHPQHNIED